jgi:hypothetical protein
MRAKIYSILLALGMAAAAAAKAGITETVPRTHVDLVLDAGWLDVHPTLRIPRQSGPEWDLPGASAFAAQHAAVDLAMITPGLLLEQPARPAPFFGVVVHFSPGYHGSGTAAVAFPPHFN